MKKTLIGGRDVYYFDSRFFEIDGRKYEIIGTESTGRFAMDCKHTVKSLETGRHKEMAMSELVQIFKRNKLID